MSTKGESTSQRLATLNRQIVSCQRCPRLIAYGRQVARDKRAAYKDHAYWGKPVPNFLPCDEGKSGDQTPGYQHVEAVRILMVGLAPGAHGAHRTGRMFTGDRSGDFLYDAMHQASLCNQPTSVDRDDGLQLQGVAITAAVHCAPPGNRPKAAEQHACRPFLEQLIASLPDLRVIVALGRIAHDAVVRLARENNCKRRGNPISFEHGKKYDLVLNLPVEQRSSCGRRKQVSQNASQYVLVDSYHPSQQNTFTGRLNRSMMVQVMELAKSLAMGSDHDGIGIP